MNDYWFEIVRRSRKRYDWVFVADRDSRPKVLARSGRDYRSRKKARRAIERLKDILPYAQIRSRDSFRLPYSKFEVVPGVLPLRVQSAPTGFLSSAAHERQYAGVTPMSAQEPGTSQAQLAASRAEPEAAQAEPPEPPRADVAETEVEPEPKPAATGRRRR